MTEKEFSKLRRRELLELLLMQTREQKQLEDQMVEKTKRIHELEQSFDRLAQTLDTKDYLIADMKEYQDELEGRIAELKRRLAEKDSLIEELQAKLTEGESGERIESLFEGKDEQNEKRAASFADLERDDEIEKLIYNLRKKVGTAATRAILSNVIQLTERKRQGASRPELYNDSQNARYEEEGGSDE